MPSFDIVSEVNQVEVHNAVDQCNKEIANHLSIAEKTVKNHVSNILKALQVNSRTEAAMKAVRAKLVQGN